MESSFDRVMKNPLVPIIIVIVLFAVVSYHFAQTKDEWVLAEEEPSHKEAFEQIREPEAVMTNFGPEAIRRF